MLRRAFVVELFGHEMCLLSVVQSLRSCEDLELHVISSDHVKRNVMQSSFFQEDVEWHEVKTEEPERNRLIKSAKSFKRVIEDVRQAVFAVSERNDLVLINTVECDLCHLLRRNLVEPLNARKLKVLVGVHNSYFFMSGFPDEVDQDLKRFYRLPLKNRFRKKHLPSSLSSALSAMVVTYRRKTLKMIASSVAGYYVFGSQVVTPSNSKARLVFSAKPIDLGVVTSRRRRIIDITDPGKKMVFAVTGKVDLHRRDYISVLKLFEHIDPRRFELVLLGESADSRVKNLVDNSGIRDAIRTFNQRISEDEFEYWISKTDFIIAPVSEMPPYGKFKISGNPGDAFSAGLPLIIPYKYFEGTAPPGTLLYNDFQELQKIVEKLIDDRKFSLLISNQALDNASRAVDDLRANASVCRSLNYI